MTRRHAVIFPNLTVAEGRKSLSSCCRFVESNKSVGRMGPVGPIRSSGHKAASVEWIRYCVKIVWSSDHKTVGTLFSFLVSFVIVAAALLDP
jgi:hypothetical protein